MFTANSSTDLLLRLLILCPIALLWLIFVVRVLGLRTFSKMTAVDFIVTLATGSLLATAVTATTYSSIVQSLGAAAFLLVLQKMFSFLRRKFKLLKGVAENEPLLLMKDGEFLHAALDEADVTESDLIAKLREANALELSAVRAVVLETTGDISVMHGGEIDERLLEDVRRR